MLAQPHGHQSYGCMGVVGGADCYRVYTVSHFVKEHAIIGISFGFGEAFLAGHVEPELIYVANGNHIASFRGVLGVAGTATANADTSHGKPFVGRLVFLSTATGGNP